MKNTQSNTSISVVVPAYNAEKTIQSTLLSALNQDYDHFDVYVVDDGSSDRTVLKVWEMREKFIEQGVKLHVIAQKNTGVSSARNRGVKASSGKYIAFLDADDKWLPNKLNQHALMMDENSKVGVSFAQVAYINSDKQRYGELSATFNEPIKVTDMLDVNPTISPSNWVARRSAFNHIDGFNTEMSHAEDQDFIIRLIANSEFTVESIHQYLTQYVTSESGLSADLNSMYRGWNYLVNSIQSSKFQLKQDDYSRLHSNYCWYLARRSWQVKSCPKIGLKFCWKAMTTDLSNVLSQPSNKVKIIIAVACRCIFPIRVQQSGSQQLTNNNRSIQPTVSAEANHV